MIYRAIGRAFVVIVIVLAAIKSGAFGYIWGQAAGFGLVLLCFNVCVEGIKAMLLPTAVTAFREDRYGVAAAATIITVTAILWGFVNAVGVAATVRTSAAGQLKSQQQTGVSNREEVSRLATKLQGPAPRSEGDVRADLAKLYSRRTNDGTTIQQVVGDCRDLTSAAARSYCPKILPLEAELARTIQWSKDEAALAALRSAKETNEGTLSIDPQADAIAKALGVKMENVQLAIILGFAFFLELLCSTGLYAFENQTSAAKTSVPPVTEQPQPTPVTIPVVPPFELPPIPLELAERQPEPVTPAPVALPPPAEKKAASKPKARRPDRPKGARPRLVASNSNVRIGAFRR